MSADTATRLREWAGPYANPTRAGTQALLREAADLLDAQAARLERAEQEEEYLRHKADDFERRLEQAEQALREIAGKHYAGVYWDGTPTGPDAVAALQEIARAALAVGHGVAADTKAET